MSPYYSIPFIVTRIFEGVGAIRTPRFLERAHLLLRCPFAAADDRACVLSRIYELSHAMSSRDDCSSL